MIIPLPQRWNNISVSYSINFYKIGTAISTQASSE